MAVGPIRINLEVVQTDIWQCTVQWFAPLDAQDENCSCVSERF